MISMFNADEYWRSSEKDCPYAEGNRCFLVAEPSDESCKGCNWYKYAHGEKPVWKSAEEDE